MDSAGADVFIAEIVVAVAALNAHAVVPLEARVARGERHHDVGDGAIAAPAPIHRWSLGKQWGIAEFAAGHCCRCHSMAIRPIAALPTQNGVLVDHPVVGGDEAQREGHRFEVVAELVVEMLAAAGAHHRDAVVGGERPAMLLDR